ncbi:glutathione S-transferase N-terminal domain-containing protein [Rhodanobacter lindaniclasticus]
MLIHDAISPAPRCLRMFVLEKGLQLPAVTVDVMRGENREPAWLVAVNQAGQTPALRLGAGAPVLAEAVAMTEQYLEELHPAPALMGRTPEQRAQTRQWWRRRIQRHRVHPQCLPLRRGPAALHRACRCGRRGGGGVEARRAGSPGLVGWPVRRRTVAVRRAFRRRRTSGSMCGWISARA